MLVGHLPSSSADAELGSEGLLSPNLLPPEQGAAPAPAQGILVTPPVLHPCTSAAADPPLWGNLGLK